MHSNYSLFFIRILAIVGYVFYIRFRINLPIFKKYFGILILNLNVYLNKSRIRDENI